MVTPSSPSIRSSPFTRTSLARSLFDQPTRRPFPRWLRRLLLVLLALLLLLIALVACNENEKPLSLATSTLDGPRLTTGPICIEEAVDVSGSMTAYTAQRERAEGELFTFARRELEKHDMLSETFFAGSAVLALPPTSLASLGGPPPVTGDFEDGTLLAPAVAALMAARPTNPTACAARALVVITDGEIYDDQQTLNAVLTKANYTRMYAVVPAGITGVGRGQLRGGLLDSVTVYGFHDGGTSGRAASVFGDAKPLDVVFGEILGGLTGQHLNKAGRPPTQAS
jgi:hypothetical protein